ncbi:MAG TPA: DUF2281 domain-containing protein [Phycisphaerae bacterium]|jgi:hypothetical protein
MRAFRVIQRVQSAGTVQVDQLPLQEGQTVEVIVVPLEDRESDDLSRLADSGLAFWDNPIDHEVWNDALPPA